MAIAHSTDIRMIRDDEVAINAIHLADLRMALAQGWDDFLSKRGDLVFVGLIYPAVVILAALYAMNMSILPLVFPLFSGAILLGPAAASGFYELARRRERGMDTSWRHFFDVMRGPRVASLAAMTTVTALLFIAWIGVASFIYSMTLGSGEPWTVSSFLRALFTTAEGWTMIVAGNLAGLVFAVVTLAISVISFPMLVDRRVSWDVAARTSVRVAQKNPVTVAIWGLIVVALLVLGALPAFVGLTVVLPVLGYATWHLYTRAVVR